jgi:plastocyanin
MERRAIVPLVVAAMAAVVTTLVPTVGAGADTSGAIVVVRDSNYTPSQVGIRPGDVVIWTRPDGVTLTHSVTSDDGRFDAELTDQRRNVGFRFQEAGTYAYHCKFHGSPGGGGMAGVIVVEGDSTTTTTAPGPTTTTTPTTGPTTTTSTAPTTTTTVPPTTTTTKPPKPPKTTTTTTPPPPPPPPPTHNEPPPPPVWEPPPPPPPESPSSGAMNPPPVGRPAPEPPPRRAPAPTSAKDRPAAAHPGNGKEPAPPTTDTTAPAAPDPAAIAAAEAAALAAAATAAPPPEAAPPAPAGPPAVEPLDPAILDTLAAASDKPPDNGSSLLIVAGIGLALFVLCVGAWAWYHRASRYMPA